MHVSGDPRNGEFVEKDFKSMGLVQLQKDGPDQAQQNALFVTGKAIELPSPP
jgi:hypothetical protein